MLARLRELNWQTSGKKWIDVFVLTTTYLKRKSENFSKERYQSYKLSLITKIYRVFSIEVDCKRTKNIEIKDSFLIEKHIPGEELILGALLG